MNVLLGKGAFPYMWFDNSMKIEEVELPDWQVWEEDCGGDKKEKCDRARKKLGNPRL